MEIKKNSIVKVKGTNQVFEVIEVTGAIALCLPITSTSLRGSKVPFKLDELEVLIDGETDAFNLLFREDADEQ